MTVEEEVKEEYARQMAVSISQVKGGIGKLEGLLSINQHEYCCDIAIECVAIRRDMDKRLRELDE